jgi:hypothetical protein
VVLAKFRPPVGVADAVVAGADVVGAGDVVGSGTGSPVEAAPGVPAVARVAAGVAGLGTVVRRAGRWDSVTTRNRVFVPAGFATPSTLPSESRRNAAVSAGTIPRERARWARGPGPDTASIEWRSESCESASASERCWRSRIVKEPFAMAVLRTRTPTKPPSSSRMHSARKAPLP